MQRVSQKQALMSVLLVVCTFLVLTGASSKVESSAPPKAPVFFGAGDIADCRSPGDEQTGLLLDAVWKSLNGGPGAVFTLGDNAYGTGRAIEFAQCYEPSWGRHKTHTRPSPGNHDYYSAGAAPYFGYFGPMAGPAGRGYYSFEMGNWHIVSLNSNIDARIGSAQERWLRDDLQKRKVPHILAYWHHPLYSSGPHGNSLLMQDIWRTLMEFDADVVLCGHDHDYERFAPQDADGRPNPRGIREFVVGTGGAQLYQFKKIAANSEVRNDRSWGILKLTLNAQSYSWEFIPVAGQSFRDSGTGTCVSPKPGKR
ncbi:MAG: metallophosphoesterase [Blastocatellia bacterium]|nr:metallophosphoesterase [Blastocatellia bacterium]